MNNFLDKTISVRKLWRWTRRVIYVAIPLYVLAVFWNAWNLRIGGVGLNDSPFKDQVPEQCRGYAQRSFGTPPDRTAVDNLLLRGRLARGSIEALASGVDRTPVCIGYAVLGGLHGKTRGDANFIEQWVDVHGDPVVTVRVEYHKAFVPAKENKK